ncbi:conserved hypothetical protein [Tenacibaculum litopenaei]|uniref:hypothetical protein n=1 Tax=Tenacibaculum litopenaei TaxID=396016 RepID=UPI0038944E62
MNGISPIIQAFSEREYLEFEAFLTHKNRRGDVKNTALVRLLRAGKTDTAFLCEQLYAKPNKQALYSLRNRVFEVLIDFIASSKMQGENSIDISLAKYILAARDFLYQKNYKLAYKLLIKTEKIALAHDLYTLLTEVYHTLIQYAHHFEQVDLKVLIERFRKNQQLQNTAEEFNIIYAKIRNALQEQQQQGTSVSFSELVSRISSEHAVSINDILSYKSLYQMITLTNLSAYLSKDYLKIESFIIAQHQVLKAKKDQEKQLFYHIRVLFLIANTLFRNKKFESSLSYLQQMKQAMVSQQKKYYTTFLPEYTLLLALNTNYLGNQQEAIRILEGRRATKNIQVKIQLESDLTLIMCYFQNQNYTAAYKAYTKLQHSDLWYEQQAGIEITIKKNLIALLLHKELNHFDLFESRLLSFRRKYRTFLLSHGEERVLRYLEIVERFHNDPQWIRSEDCFQMVESSFDFIGALQEDIFAMSFYAWLKSKMHSKDLFATTLELIKTARMD